MGLFTDHLLNCKSNQYCFWQESIEKQILKTMSKTRELASVLGEQIEKCSDRQWRNVTEATEIQIHKNIQIVSHMDSFFSLSELQLQIMAVNPLNQCPVRETCLQFETFGPSTCSYAVVQCPGFFLCHEILVQDETGKDGAVTGW